MDFGCKCSQYSCGFGRWDRLSAPKYFLSIHQERYPLFLVLKRKWQRYCCKSDMRKIRPVLQGFFPRIVPHVCVCVCRWLGPGNIATWWSHWHPTVPGRSTSSERAGPLTENCEFIQKLPVVCSTSRPIVSLYEYCLLHVKAVLYILYWWLG